MKGDAFENMCIFLKLMLFCIIIFSLRIVYLFVMKSTKILGKKNDPKCVKTMFILGSGGHTAEMIKIIENLNLQNYKPRVYVYAHTDKISEEKIKNLEKRNNDYCIKTIYRSREVKQSYLSSVLTTIIALFHATVIIIQERPNVILCNGPGTCVPLCIIAFLFKLLFICNATVIFIESFCRVKTLSLSGILLYYIVDHFIVQWPTLKTQYKKTVFL